MGCNLRGDIYLPKFGRPDENLEAAKGCKDLDFPSPQSGARRPVIKDRDSAATTLIANLLHTF